MSTFFTMVRGFMARASRACGKLSSWCIGVARAFLPWRKEYPRAARGALLLVGFLVLLLVGKLGDGPLGSIALADPLARGTTAGAPSTSGSTRVAVADSSVSARPVPLPSSEPAEAPAPRAVLEDGRVVLNLATSEDLHKLHGIGVKRAEAILALRARLGGKFHSLSELLRVKGLGRKTLARLHDKLLLDPPSLAKGP